MKTLLILLLRLIIYIYHMKIKFKEPITPNVSNITFNFKSSKSKIGK